MKNKKSTTLSEQFQNAIEKEYKEAKSIPLTHKYMIWLGTGTSVRSGRVHILEFNPPGNSVNNQSEGTLQNWLKFKSKSNAYFIYNSLNGYWLLVFNATFHNDEVTL